MRLLSSPCTTPISALQIPGKDDTTVPYTLQGETTSIGEFGGGIKQNS